jgi:hypothetical protein
VQGGFLGFKDDDAFWRNPMARQDKVIMRLLERKPGLLIDGPSEVASSMRQSLPVVVGLVMTYEELHGLDPGRVGAVVAVNVDTSQVWVTTFEDMENVEPESDPGPPPALSGVGAMLYLVELRERAALPWAQGTSFLVSACLRERASNRLAVTLGAGAQVYVDPAVQELVHARRRAFALQVSPELESGVLQLEDAPARKLVPAAPGMSIAVDRVVVTDGDTPVTLRLGLRAAVRPWERARPKQKSDPELDARVSAVVPITLLVTGAAEAAPRVIELRVPVMDELGDEPEPVGTASFAVDLRQLEGFPKLPGTYYVSAFSGAHAAGPATVATISPLSMKGA